MEFTTWLKEKWNPITQISEHIKKYKKSMNNINKRRKAKKVSNKRSKRNNRKKIYKKGKPIKRNKTKLMTN